MQDPVKPHRGQTELVEACLKGDRSAWTNLVERYQKHVFSIALDTCADTELAEEVLQGTFLSIWKGLRRLRDREALTTWIGRIATREALRVRRHYRKTAFVSLSDAVASPETDHLEELERAQLLQDAMVGLSERCRQLITGLFFVDDIPTYDELAEELGVPRGALGPRRRRCLDQLRVELIRLSEGFFSSLGEF